MLYKKEECSGRIKNEVSWGRSEDFYVQVNPGNPLSNTGLGIVVVRLAKLMRSVIEIITAQGRVVAQHGILALGILIP